MRDKILVTGGAGFIASHIVDKYITLGYLVIVLDNLSTGTRRNIHPKAKFYMVDIRDMEKIKKIITKEKPSIINHHAAIAEVVKSLRNPFPTFDVNATGTINLLICGGIAGIKKFIFSSTGGAIYGEPSKIPVDENCPAVPLSPYGLSKLLGEETIKFYSRRYGFDYLIFRYPNVYGPRQNPKGEAGVVAIFAGLIKKNVKPTIFGNGTKTRDYVYIDDIIKANIIGLKKGKNAIFNLGWGEEISDQMIFDEIAKSFRFNKTPIYASFRKGEVCHISLNANKAKKVLGWRPKIQFKEGVEKYINTIYKKRGLRIL